MDILYGIQGTGNGHISRAGAIIPHLQKSAHVDVLISGHSADVQPAFPIAYRVGGVGYTFGKKGGIDYFTTAKNVRLIQFWKDVKQLPVEKYDLIISDFEPVTAWACKLKGKPCMALSHQASFLSYKTPRPSRKSIFGETVLKKYAPATNYTGFHFQNYDDHILTPIIRDEIRNAIVTNEGHITIYLPAYHHSILKELLADIKRPIHLFSKNCKKFERHGHIRIYPVSDKDYLDSLSSCSLLICGAGFEAPSEGLFLGKKMICIPMKGQYEQHCNSAALKEMGVLIGTKADQSLTKLIEFALSLPEPNPILFPDIMEDVLVRLVKHVNHVEIPPVMSVQESIL